jgi:hypothetical protein
MGTFFEFGRKCVQADGGGSQTVRISALPYRRGVYDWVVRFKADAPLKGELPNADRSSLDAFVACMRDNPNLQGEIERAPPDHDALLVTNRHRPAGTLSPIASAVIGAVEAAIDQLVCDFLRHPYRHRSENNVHCEVYGRLKAAAELSGLCNLGSGEPVQLVHREWPEDYAVKRLGGFRLNEIWPLGGPTQSAMPTVGRGKYDLAVLTPDAVAACRSVREYADGKISPLVALEFGLNERYEHLREDVAKLNSNRIPHGYIVHLLRPDTGPDNFGATERLLELVAGNNPVRAAFARVEMISRLPCYHYKFVGDTGVSVATTLPAACGPFFFSFFDLL